MASPKKKTDKQGASLQSVGQKALTTAPASVQRLLGGIGGVRFAYNPNSPVASYTRQYNPQAVAAVEEHDPNTVQVFQPSTFAAPNNGDYAVHEAVHLIQNNLPPSVQAQIPSDNPSDPYNYGGALGLMSARAAGKTMMNMSREQQAQIVQDYTRATSPHQAQLQKKYSSPADLANWRKSVQAMAPFVNDLNKQQLSVIQMTSPDQPGINTMPRAPLPPPNWTTGAPADPPPVAPAPKKTGAQGATPYMVVAKPKGLVEAGNLPIWDRPVVKNADGTHSSEYSTSFEDEHGHEVLVPTVVNGKFLTPNGAKPPEGSGAEKAMFANAWHHYLQTGEHLGKFNSPDSADAYAGALHNRDASQAPDTAGVTGPPAWASKPGSVPDPEAPQDAINAAGQAALAKLPPQLRRLISDKQIKFVPGAGDQQTYKAGKDYTSVESGSPDTIYVNDPKTFTDPRYTSQLVAHEVMHLVQNNAHPTVQNQIPEDDTKDPYNVGGEAGLNAHVANGGNMWTLPREKQAAAIQYYVSQREHADPARQAALDKTFAPYMSDLDNLHRANIESTPGSSETINTHPNAPLPPAGALN